jgi:uncharacterized phage protein (TIGR01671 family)
MNNRFKFRVWDGYSFEYDPSLDGLKENYDITGFSDLENHKECILQQYTGLTDSNDKEIYEGDILKIHYDVGGDVIGQVLYEADEGGYIFQWKRKGRNQDYNNLNCDLAFESVIVGNIFEHSELLK